MICGMRRKSTDGPGSLRGIKRLIISGIRRELLAHDRMEKAIARHVGNCPGAKWVKASRSSRETEQPHGVAKWLVLLLPYRWPLAVAFFSPFSVAKIFAQRNKRRCLERDVCRVASGERGGGD